MHCKLIYKVWEFVNFKDYMKMSAELAKSYKAVKIASDIDSSSSVSAPVSILETTPEQRQSLA